jgi:hypothetical protein
LGGDQTRWVGVHRPQQLLLLLLVLGHQHRLLLLRRLRLRRHQVLPGVMW